MRAVTGPVGASGRIQCSAVDHDQAYRPASGVTLPREPKQERSRRKQEQLLAAAESLFAERGYEAVTADDIAERAGYGTGTFYNYFANKMQAFVMVADRHEQAVVPTLAPVRAALEEGADVREAVRATVRSVLENKARVPWLVGSWNRLVLTEPDVAAFRRRVNDAWEEQVAALVRAGMAAGTIRPADPVGLASAMRILVEAGTTEVVVHGEPDADVFVESVTVMLTALLLDEPPA